MTSDWKFNAQLSPSYSNYSNYSNGTADTFIWPPLISSPVYDQITYPTPGIQIYPPTSDQESIEKLRRTLQEYFGIQDLRQKVDKANIEKPREVSTPLHRGRIIERVE